MEFNFTLSELEGSEDFFTNLPSSNINSIPSSRVTSPPVSQEEVVIRSRGRRQFPPSLSPERQEGNSPVYERHFPSPPASTSDLAEPSKPEKKTRSASRLSANTDLVRRQLNFRMEEEEQEEFAILKRLPVIDKEESHDNRSRLHHSEREFLGSHKVKKQKMAMHCSDHDVPSLQLAKGLSKQQLIGVLVKLTTANPSLSPTLEELLPKPDLTDLIKTLTYLNQNIYKALPVTRLSDRADSLAHNRVYTHLLAFKKSLVEDLGMLVNAGQWDSVYEYVILSWDIVGGTPVWTNPVHNTTRNSCYKHLATAAIKAIKHQNSTPDDVRKQLITLMTGSVVREVQLCREMLLQM